MVAALGPMLVTGQKLLTLSGLKSCDEGSALTCPPADWSTLSFHEPSLQLSGRQQSLEET